LAPFDFEFIGPVVAAAGGTGFEVLDALPFETVFVVAVEVAAAPAVVVVEAVVAAAVFVAVTVVALVAAAVPPAVDTVGFVRQE
jgi:hypothetical protein